ncbi:MAG TPA: hypothetical protein VGG45_18235 [Terracidiphilus sp.]|jgi:hypothetical protein
MWRHSALACASIILACGVVAAQPEVTVDTSQLKGPRPLEDQTKAAAIRDYLESWQGMNEAFQQDQPSLLDEDFIGTAKDKLTDTIDEQAKTGIHTRYQDRVHHIQFLFYSPEGLSIELIDDAEYDVQVLDHDKAVSTVPSRARYIVVLTPAEVRWKVRVMQADSQ